MGCHLVLGYVVTIRNVEAAMADKPRGAELIVVGGLYVYIGKEGGRGRNK